MTCIHRRNSRRTGAFQTAIAAHRLLTTAVAMAVGLPALPAHAAPTGGVVAAGAGAISQQGATTTITQSAAQSPGPARMVINWNSFSSTAGESIVFNQPNAAAIALNRVTGASPSQLMGSLSANGQVFILNPNGVLFGAGSQVNAGGLLASTLGMDPAGFMAGAYALQGSSSARVVNQGAIKVAEGGYIALVGPAVVNDGSMSATRGDALLAAGDKVTLRLEGGSLLGYTMDLGSANALVDNSASGVISANGGRVVLEARAADALSKAVVNHAGLIEAQTLDGSKGSIRLMGDMNVGQSNVSGTLDASAPNGGDGGFIETSAARVKIANSTKVTTVAVSGITGTWLIDPIDFEIAPGNGALTDSSIGAATLAAALGKTNTTIGTTTSNAGTGQGDITVNDVVAWQGFGKLTLQAQRNIVFNASLAGASLALLYGQASPNGDSSDFYFNNGAKIFLNGAGGTFSTQRGSNATLNLKNYTIVRSLGTEGTANRSTLQGVSSPDAATNYALGADILDGAQTAKWSGGQGFSPLASLSGTFEGLGHEISGLTINRSSANLGLFTNIGSGAVVHNLNITKANITGVERVGILAGTNFGTTQNVYVTGNVVGTERTGGVVGGNSGTIYSSHSDATVVGGRIAGGLVGENSIGVISDSYASGAVSAGDPNGAFLPDGPGYAGGLVGFNRAAITRSYASGTTTGAVAAGGLVGGNLGVIDNSYAQGVVTGNTWVGGLVGEARAGTVIKNSYAAGAVTGTASVGGLVGKAETQTLITDTYATGAVRGINSATTRGLVGEAADGLVPNSYWNIDTIAQGGTGQTASGAGVGETGTQLQQAATFSGWNIAITGGTDKVWRLYEDNGMPLLRSFLAPLVLDVSRGAKYSGKEQTSLAIPTTGARSGTAASGRNVGTYQPYSNQLGYDISNGELLITPAPLVIDAQIATKVYNGGTDAKATLTDNRIAGDALTVQSSSASFGDKNVGVAKPVAVSGIKVTGADAANYVYQTGLSAFGTITPLNLVYSIGGLDKVYDGKTDTRVLISGNQIAGDKVFVDYSGNFVDKNAGVAKAVSVTNVTLSGNDAPNYTHQLQQLSTSASITQRPLGITATAVDKVYDGTTSASSVLQDNRVVGDVFQSNAIAKFDDKNASAGKNVTVSGVTLTGTDARNYSYQPQVINTTASITQRPLGITATAVDKVYDGTVAALPVLQDNRVAGDVFQSTALANFDDKNAGPGKNVTVSGISISGTDAANYLYQPQVINTTASITQRPLGITATAVDKVYDGTTSASSVLQDNRVVGDVFQSNAIAKFDDKNASAGKNVTVSGITLTGTDGLNYSYQPQVTTTASITQRPLGITATAVDKVYDGTTTALPTLEDNRVAGDILVASGIASFDNRNAGAGKQVTISGISIAGADAANYLYKPQLTTTSASITQRPLAITATAPDKAYDGTTLTSAALADNRVAGDAVTASFQRAEFADKNGGQQKTVTISGIAISGADALNYQANTSATASAGITPIGLTITANPDSRLATGVPYQGGNGVSYAGFIPGETAAVLHGQLRYAGDAQGALKEGFYRITPGGLTSVNYASTFVDGALTIQPLPLGIGLVVAYTEPAIPRPLPYAVRNTGGALHILECGMRMPENLLLGGCQTATQPGNPGQ